MGRNVCRAGRHQEVSEKKKPTNQTAAATRLMALVKIVKKKQRKETNAESVRAN